MLYIFFFFQAEDGIRDLTVTGVQTCALPICDGHRLGGAPDGDPQVPAGQGRPMPDLRDEPRARRRARAGPREGARRGAARDPDERLASGELSESPTLHSIIERP